MIRFNCPNCRKQISTNDTTAGKRGKCPGCGAAVKVPALVSDDDVLSALGNYEPPKPIEAVTAEVVSEPPPRSHQREERGGAKPPPLQAIPPKRTSARNKWLIAGGAVLGYFVLVVINEATTPARPPQREPQPADAQALVAHEAAHRVEGEQARLRQAAAAERSKKIEAWTMAELFVKDHLKSPSTASFGSIVGEWQDPGKRVQKFGSDGTYIVTGWVDAQNAFGATLRNDFSVKIQDRGDKWVLTGEVILYPR